MERTTMKVPKHRHYYNGLRNHWLGRHCKKLTAVFISESPPESGRYFYCVRRHESEKVDCSILGGSPLAKSLFQVAYNDPGCNQIEEMGKKTKLGRFSENFALIDLDENLSGLGNRTSRQMAERTLARIESIVEEHPHARQILVFNALPDRKSCSAWIELCRELGHRDGFTIIDRDNCKFRVRKKLGNLEHYKSICGGPQGRKEKTRMSWVEDAIGILH